MINAPQLLADLTRLLKRLEDDLLQRITDMTELKAGLQAEWQAARDAERTAETFESWADQVITQAGVHWLLSCVFLRFIEDNELVDRPWLGGTPQSGRLALARDRHEAYFRDRPLESDRDYLLASFREAGALPGLHTFFDETHNPVFRLGITGDGAMALRQFWQQVDPNTGALVHDFTDGHWNTRFLGDLYQDLSEATRKRYALLQTPEFVEEFILDRTLTPAIREFGFREVRMIDPTCGSGHFLLGGFRRLVDEWLRREPARNPRDIAQRALDAVAGVDLNPFAVAISRFRLLVAALNVSGIRRLTEAPDFKPNVAIGDSLLHGKRFGMTATDGMFEGAEHYAGTGLAHAYASEDLPELQRILGRRYHAVVGNPPYVTAKDPALAEAYRKRFSSCHRQYSLAVPFIERFFELTWRIGATSDAIGGYVGLITTNSFAKKEFGRKLVEDFLPSVDVTHIIDTSRAHIPGHGTSTMLLFGRGRPPVAEAIRCVLGIRGEAPRPMDPSRGKVWLSIVTMIDRAGAEDDYVTVEDVGRQGFRNHPWALGGGGANELKGFLENRARPLAEMIDHIGYTGQTNADDAMVGAARDFLRARCEPILIKQLVAGESVRDFRFTKLAAAYVPYIDGELVDISKFPGWYHRLWPLRTSLWNRATFSKKTYREEGRPWWEWHLIRLKRLSDPLSLAFANVATHNHFAFSRAQRVFNSHAPVIKLTDGSDASIYLRLLSVLASSCGCFWMKQVCSDKGVGGIGGGIGDEPWEPRFEFDAAKLERFPVPESEMPELLAHRLDSLAQEYGDSLPSSSSPCNDDAKLPKERAQRLRRAMIGAQEELDWQVYASYGLAGKEALFSSTSVPELELGERAFEIAIARGMADNEVVTSWFERHGSTPITEMPPHWPEDYRRVVQYRLELIERDRNIGLIERPEYKRRWNTPAWEDLERAALRDWLLDRLEAPHLWPANAEHPPQLTTVTRLADAVRSDAGFMQIAELYAGHSGFDVAQVVAELVAGEAVPFLPVLRYTDTGLRKRAQWEDTWALQRREDGGEKVGKIPVPPKYQSKDFLKADFWRLRGGLDVPKERWVSYPGCERGADASLPIAWAGWSHLQQSTAVAAYYLEMKENEGWEPARLQPLLVGLLELLPWLEQWHNEIDPAYGECMGTYYRGFVNEEARALGLTLEDLRTWKPTLTGGKRGSKRAVPP